MRILFSTFFCFLFIVSFSQVKITGEIRPRSELRDGYKTPKDENSTTAFFTSQRSRITFDYKSNNYEAKLSFQDVRVWGDEKMSTDVASISLHEAWVKFKLLDSIYVKTGRQTICHDNGRLFSPSNWSQTSKKHDALLLLYKSGSWDLTIGNAFNQLAENISGTDYTNSTGNYKFLSYFWGTYSGSILSISGTFIADGFQSAPDTVNTRITWGAIAEYKKNKLKIIARSFMQGGKTTEDIPIEAYLIHSEIEYKISNATVTIGMELQSGNDYKKTDGKFRAFNTLYGTKHYMNGTMDYFTKSVDTKNTGLLDAYLKFKIPFGKKHTLYTDYHFFTTKKVYYNTDTQSEMNKYLGSELDLYLRSKLSKDIKLECGYSCMIGSKTLAAVKGGNSGKFNHWVYAMISFNPTFFISN